MKFECSMYVHSIVSHRTVEDVVLRVRYSPPPNYLKPLYEYIFRNSFPNPQPPTPHGPSCTDDPHPASGGTPDTAADGSSLRRGRRGRGREEQRLGVEGKDLAAPSRIAALSLSSVPSFLPLHRKGQCSPAPRTEETCPLEMWTHLNVCPEGVRCATKAGRGERVG